MVQNKKLVDELKKYNNALEKHFTNLDFDSISGFSDRGGTSISDKDEFYSLIATSIMDTKTEMALMRKNLSVEIEGMTRRMIQDEQNMFIEQMNKFYGKIIFELKENLNSHVKEINSDVAELKRDINEISLRNKDFSKNIESFGGEIGDFKQAIVSIGELSVKNNNSSKELISKLNDFENKFDRLFNEISKKNNFIENNAMAINKKLVNIESKVHETEEIMLNERTLIEKELNQNRIGFDNVDIKFREMENFLLKLDNISKTETKKLATIIENRKTEKEELSLFETALVEKKKLQNKKGLSEVEQKLISVNNSLSKLGPKSTKNNNLLRQKENKKQVVNTTIEDTIQIQEEVLSKSNLYEELLIKSKNKQPMKMDSKIDKILEINKRLEKLESLR